MLHAVDGSVLPAEQEIEAEIWDSTPRPFSLDRLPGPVIRLSTHFAAETGIGR